MKDFKQIKVKANGMLPEKVYEKIYQCAYEAKQGNIVEVGTAHGAGTIALALGLKDSGKQAKVYTFEKIIGGSRERYGGIDENIKIIKENFKHFNVESQIELIIGDVETQHKTLMGKDDFTLQPISLLMLDADGSIDRDFSCFYNQLLPGAPIIIDDCNDIVSLQHFGKSRIKIDLKHKLTHELISFLITKNYLEKVEIINHTFFGIKPKQITENIDFSSLNFEKVYRKLVFLEGDLLEIQQIKVFRRRIRKLFGKLFYFFSKE